MAGQTYQVSYIIDVNATTAQTALNKFKQAVSSLAKSTKPITDLQRQVRGLMETMSAFSSKNYTVKIDTSQATRKLGKLISALTIAEKKAASLRAMGIVFGGASTAASSTARIRSRERVTQTPAQRAVRPTQVAKPAPQNLGYKLMGPTPLPSNGGMAIDMLKGMGIAYGIAGFGTLISNIVNQSVEYDNLMKTVENILKSHDTGADFSTRFAQMTATIRNVGMETKYKVTEVADAAKFLAMAGLDVNAISQAIRPIADIALVGDTELGATADLVTNIMTAYNIAPSQMRNAADIMTNTFTMSNTTLTEIAESYKYAAALLSAGKVSFEESTAAIGILGDAGIKGSQAGTTLRTLMANIVNPTKKQKAAWDELGINRYNEDGTRKTLIEIFKELNSANVDVSYFYRLFHRTAASGAVALASHVKKWQEVYLENFLAGGLTAQLADEKKNTIQGLWAQLTSVFTDNGVTAFSGVQGQIRNLLKRAIDWLKTDEAKAKFKEVSKVLMEFVNILIQASKWFANLINWFGPLLKCWIKFQLLIWPVVKAIAAFKTIALSLMAVRRISYTIIGLGHAFGFLKTSAITAGAATQATSAQFATSAAMTRGATMVSPAPGVTHYAGPWGSMFGLSASQMNTAAQGFKWFKKWQGWKPLSLYTPEPDSNSGRPYKWTPLTKRSLKGAKLNTQKLTPVQSEWQTYNRRLKFMQGANMAGTVAGGVGVAVGINKMMDEDSTGWGIASGALYAAAGVSAMLGPMGMVVGAGLAILGVFASWVDSVKQSERALNDLTQKMNSHKLVNGIILDSQNTTMQYLEIEYNKHVDINKAIEKRIELTSKLLGLTSQESPVGESTGAFEDRMEKGKELSFGDKIQAINSTFAWLSLATRYNQTDQTGGFTFARSYALVPTSEPEPRQYWNNNEFDFKNEHIGAVEAAYITSSALAEVMGDGGYYSKITSQFYQNIGKFALGQTSYSDFKNYVNQFKQRYNPANMTDLTQPADITGPYKTVEEMRKDAIVASVLWDSLSKLLRPIESAANKFYTEKASGKLETSTIIDFLSKITPGQASAALARFSPYNWDSWFSSYGFDGTSFNGMTKEIDGVVKYFTPQEVAAMAASDMQAIIKTLNLLGLGNTEAGLPIMQAAQRLLSYAQANSNTSQELIKVAQNQRLEINGQMTQWDEVTQSFQAIDENGQVIELVHFGNELGNSIGFIRNKLAVNWDVLGSRFTTTTDSVYNFLDRIGNFQFMGIPGLPLTSRGFKLDTPNLSSGFPRLGTLSSRQGVIPSGFLFQRDRYSVANRISSAMNNMQLKPLSFSLQEASNIAAAGGANPKGWGQADTTTDDNTDENNDNNTNNNDGTHTSDYKPSKSERAVPKQININIGNLMNVEAIDMTNPDHAAVVANLKSEIAYALYEAAADGTMMLNGLTNS